MSVKESGLYIPDDVKSFSQIDIQDKNAIIVGINKGPIKIINLEIE